MTVVLFVYFLEVLRLGQLEVFGIKTISLQNLFSPEIVEGLYFKAMTMLDMSYEVIDHF